MPSMDLRMSNTVCDSSVDLAKRRVHVAVGVISDGADKILISRRADNAHQGGLWEFPGGKVETGETAEQALRRELFEELAIDIIEQQAMLTIAHDYPDKCVLLDVRWISAFRGESRAREGQPLRWVNIAVLHEFEFPAANRPIVAAIQQKFAITES